MFWVSAVHNSLIQAKIGNVGICFDDFYHMYGVSYFYFLILIFFFFFFFFVGNNFNFNFIY